MSTFYDIWAKLKKLKDFCIFDNYFLEKSNSLILVSDDLQEVLQIVMIQFFNQSKIRQVRVF